METKKSKPSKVLHNVDTFKSANGTFFKHEIRFENGDSGVYNSKSDTCTKFKEGVEVVYTIEPNGTYPSRIKPVQEEQGQQYNGGNKFQVKAELQPLIVAQSIFSSVCTLHSGSQTHLDMAKVMKDTEEAFNWAMSKYKTNG